LVTLLEKIYKKTREDTKSHLSLPSLTGLSYEEILDKLKHPVLEKIREKGNVDREDLLVRHDEKPRGQD